LPLIPGLNFLHLIFSLKNTLGKIKKWQLITELVLDNS
jgi:hypothetical protein